MYVSITEYQRLAHDDNGNVMPLGEGPGIDQVFEDADDVVLASETRFVRVSTDTSVTFGDKLFMPGTEYIAVIGGETLALGTP